MLSFIVFWSEKFLLKDWVLPDELPEPEKGRFGREFRPSWGWDPLKLLLTKLLAHLKYPFYPLFNFDNGINLISKSLTILISGQLLVVFTFAHIFWRYFIFAGFWPILEHEMARPTITRWAHDHAMTRRKTKAKAQTKDRRPWWLEARSCTSTLQWSPKDKAHKIRSRYFGAKAKQRDI